MVLEEATDSDAPFSYDDPSAEARSSNDYYHIDISSLPGPLWPASRSRQLNFVTRHVIVNSRYLERDLTAEEAQAMAYHWSRAFRVFTFFPHVGIAAGCYQAYRTRQTWQLPFWKRGANFDPTVVRGPGSREILRGQLALRFQTALRYFSYSTVSVFFAMFIFSAYSTTVATVGEMRDPRLAEWSAFVKEKIRTQQRERAQRRPGLDRGPTIGNEAYRRPDSDMEGRQIPISDDTSPTDGGGMDDSNYMYRQQTEDTAVPTSKPSTASSAWGKIASSRMQTKTQAEPAQREAEAKDFFGEYDDASPIATSPSAPASASRSSQSAWDRIRQQGASSSTQKSSNSSSPYPSIDSDRGQMGGQSRDSFAFSNDQEDSHLAKNQAQKEFDERLERERKGGDFGGLSERNGKW